MSSEKIETLAIKDFRGVNRFNDGTVTPPNEFYQLQNYHPINRGQLQSILGSLQENAFAIPGVEEFVEVQWLNQSFGDRKLVAFFRPNLTQLATPGVSSSNFTFSGAATAVHDFQITYVGPGGSTQVATVTGVSCQSTTTFTLPVNIPSYVAAVDIHASINPTDYSSTSPMWCATVSRRNGVFPASVTFTTNFNISNVTASSTGVVIDAGSNVTGFTAVPNATSGGLTNGRQYYVAIAPWLTQKSFSQGSGGRATRAYNALAGSQANVMTFRLPAGFSSVNLKFTFSASPVVIAGKNVTHWVLFMGPTPEDMLAVCDRVDGSILPIPDATLRTGSGVLISEVPYNSRNTIHMTSSGDMNQGGVSLQAPSARDYGIFKNIQFGGGLTAQAIQIGGGDIQFSEGTTGNLNYLGAWVLPSLPFDETTAYQLLPHINERNYTRNMFYDQNWNYTPYVAQNDATPNPIVAWDPVTGITNEIHSTQYANRLYCANNENVMFYTNGLSMKTVVPDTSSGGGQRIPICQYIGLVQDQLVLGGGGNSFANTDNNVFYADVANPNSFGTADWNTFSVYSEDSGTINGFGLFSQNLSTSGPKTFLLISKNDGNYGALYSWNGAVGSDLVVSQIDKQGFAGPRAWAQTRFGTVFIGRSGAYIVNGAQFLTPVGDEFRDVLFALPFSSLNKINCCYHQNKVKVGYSSNDSYLDREIWLELRFENGGIQKFWSGPHITQQYLQQAAIGDFNGALDVRVSVTSNLYSRDVVAPDTLNRSITLTRLGFTQEHFWKLFEWVMMSVQVEHDETFTFTFNQENGSPIYSTTGTVAFASGARQFLQTKLTQRIMGRIEQFVITNSSPYQHSIFDISLLYKTQRRRLLR